MDSEGMGSSGLVKSSILSEDFHTEEEDLSEISDEIKDYVADMGSAMPWIEASITENEVTIKPRRKHRF